MLEGVGEYAGAARDARDAYAVGDPYVEDGGQQDGQDVQDEDVPYALVEWDDDSAREAELPLIVTDDAQHPSGTKHQDAYCPDGEPYVAGVAVVHDAVSASYPAGFRIHHPPLGVPSPARQTMSQHTEGA